VRDLIGELEGRKVFLVGEIPEEILDGARAEVLRVGSGFFSGAKAEEGVILFHSKELRRAYISARNVKRVFAMSFPELGPSMELVGALREQGREAVILGYTPSKEELPGEPDPESKVRVAIVVPERVELLTWVLPGSRFYWVDYYNRGETPKGRYDLIGSDSCEYFPTYDSRTVVLAAILGLPSFPIEVKDVDGPWLNVRLRCEQRVEGEGVILRPNRDFSRFEAYRVRMNGEIMELEEGDPLVAPTGSVFLAVLGRAETIAERLREVGFRVFPEGI